MPRSPKSNAYLWTICFSFLLFALLFSAAEGFSQQIPVEKARESKGIDSFEKSIKKAIESEKANLEELKKSLKAIEESKRKFETQLQAFTIQNSAHSNLFLMPDVKIKELEEARVDNRSALDKISEMTKELKDKSNAAALLTAQAREQLSVNERQLEELKSLDSPSETSKRVIDSIQTLTRILSQKEAISENIKNIYQKRLEELKPVKEGLSSLASRFENFIEDRKKQDLFKRKTDRAIGIDMNIVLEELNQIIKKITSFFSGSFWETELSLIWSSSWFSVISAFVILLIAVILCCRLGRFIDRLLERPAMEEYPWSALTMTLFRKSIVLAAAVLFFYVYSQLVAVDYGLSLFQLIFRILAVWLFTKQPIDILRLWNHESRPHISLYANLKIRLLVILIRYFAIAYMILDWLTPGAGIILGIGRFAFEITLLIWTAFFWRFLKKRASDFFDQQYKGISVLKGTTSAGLYAVAGVGFIMELAGFGQLAIYWYQSCGKTAIIFFWSFLIFQVIRESLAKARRETAARDSLTKETVFPVKWLMLRVSLVLVILLSIFFVLLAWGAKQPLLLNIFRVLTHPIELGQLRSSILNVIYAFLILVLTSIAVRYWRHFLREKLLDQSGMETGLMDSVTSISVYLVRSIGILIALYTFGLSAASMAVAFGAVGIGLGFGLQNIFNNFISGIILLFERPIQVGDAIEVNGIWGEVRKINVRSTLVQTYDNATLIIPNSQFISSQVTNWSFKDLRLRRTIKLGVAYGSNVELVRDTLYEIASKAQRVLKYPEPVVLFYDFGDSTLVFWLRIWTDVDYMLSVESQIRFEINRLFKERGIEIAFPQRDIHVRSVDEKALLKLNPDGNKPG